MRKYFALVASLVLSGCSGGGLVATNPTPDQVQQVRAGVLRVTDATKAGLTIAGELGKTIDSLPIPAADKTKYDCGLLKVMGSANEVSPGVMQRCGAVIKRAAEAPLGVALTALASVGTCASLGSTVSALNTALAPLVADLIASTNQVVRMAGVSLQATFSLLSSGGALCLV